MSVLGVLSLGFQLFWIAAYITAFVRWHSGYQVTLPSIPLAGHAALFVWLTCTQSEWINYWWLAVIYAIAAGLTLELLFVYCTSNNFKEVQASAGAFAAGILLLTVMPIKLGAPIVGITANLALSAMYVWGVWRNQDYFYTPVAACKFLGNVGLFLSINPTEPLRWLWWPLYGIVLLLDVCAVVVFRFPSLSSSYWKRKNAKRQRRHES